MSIFEKYNNVNIYIFSSEEEAAYLVQGLRELGLDFEAQGTNGVIVSAYIEHMVDDILKGCKR